MRFSRQDLDLDLLALVACSTGLGAIEFGTMGNVSASMGGAGVALKNSAFGLYYNPALLSASPKVKFGYSFGVNIQEKNIAQLATIDIANMQDTATRLASSFSGAGGTGAVNGVVSAIDSALDSVLNNSGGTSGQTTQQKLEAYLQNNKGGNYNDLIDKIKENIQSSSSLDSIQKDLITSVVGGIDFDNLQFGNGSGGNITNVISSITISKGSDKGLDKSMSDITMVQNALQDNHMNLVSQNGLVFQLGSRPLNNMIGTFAVGLFGSLYSNISLNANSDKMRLIIEAGGQYYELKITDDGYTYGLSDKNTYDQHSLIASLQGASTQDAHSIYMTSFVLSEIPVGYARTFYLKNGNLNIGVAGKLMNSVSMQNKVAITTNTDFGAELNNIVQDFKNTTMDKAIGVDVGAVYEIDLPKFRYLTIGLVGKNLNSPTFKSTLEHIVIKPQARAGANSARSSRTSKARPKPRPRAAAAGRVSKQKPDDVRLSAPNGSSSRMPSTLTCGFARASHPATLPFPNKYAIIGLLVVSPRRRSPQRDTRVRTDGYTESGSQAKRGATPQERSTHGAFQRGHPGPQRADQQGAVLRVPLPHLLRLL